MTKQISIIFTCFIVLTTLAGCGVKKDLYQTPETEPSEQAKKVGQNNQEQIQDQQEKH
ncbi:LptM family lipoprotein [Thalassotalea sp. PLHSN55]|uniref:LptM family lipoprotein n=1 Tax=Thalassotalea sp. PLHSN55 TaxID=3435888 RepID=UPI003F8464CA